MDEYQQKAIYAFDARNHVAILGAAGTGKSHVLLQMIKRAREKFGAQHCVACAWTNNAARNINGMTLHKLFCAKINWECTEEGLWNQVRNNKKILEFLLGVKVVIIDEIFTIRSNVLDAIDFVLQKLVKVTWHEGLALGGRLLVVSGDPFQLEPVFPRYEKKSGTAEDSSVWYNCFGNDACGAFIVLPENHRQSSDPNFFSILSRMREGLHTNEDLAVINRTSTYMEAPQSHTRLVLTHQEASNINDRMMQNIKSNVETSYAFDTFIDVSEKDMMKAKHRLDQSAPETISTKVGSRVLLTRKYGELFPGTEMVVTDVRRYMNSGRDHVSISLLCTPFLSVGAGLLEEGERFISIAPTRTPIHSISGKVIAYREQLPVIPAYAITVHRSQSLSLKRVAIDFRGEVNSRWNPFGKVYVALS